METEEKRRVDVPRLRLLNWRIVAAYFVVILVAAAVIFWASGGLPIWQAKFLPGLFPVVFFRLLVSLLIALALYNVYTRVMLRLLVKPYFAGMKYLQTEEYDQALEAFKQFSAIFDQHPGRERLHTLLLVDAGKYRPREIGLLNQAFTHIQQGNGPEALRCYEQVLVLNPDSELATASLNMAAAVTGGELRPMPGYISYRSYIRWRFLSQPGWRGCLPAGLFFVLAMCCLIPFAFMVALRPARWEEGGIGLVTLVTAIIVVLFLRSINWIASRLFLMDIYRGERLLRKGQYREAIHAFQDQVTFLQENPWVDKWRWLLLPNSGPYSYQEWALHRMAYGYIQLGEGDQLLPLYEQMLALNPRNGLARSNINSINLFRGEDR